MKYRIKKIYDEFKNKYMYIPQYRKFLLWKTCDVDKVESNYYFIKDRGLAFWSYPDAKKYLEWLKAQDLQNMNYRVRIAWDHMFGIYGYSFIPQYKDNSFLFSRWKPFEYEVGVGSFSEDWLEFSCLADAVKYMDEKIKRI